MGTELVHAEGQTDRQTDMTKLMVTLRNFANALKNWGKNGRNSIVKNV